MHIFTVDALAIASRKHEIKKRKINKKQTIQSEFDLVSMTECAIELSDMA